MRGLPQGRAAEVAVVAAATITGFAAGTGATYEAVDLLTTTPEEHNAQVEACAQDLGVSATRHVGLPDACRPFETGFAFKGKWVRVRVPTHTGGLPAFESWREKIFDLPSAYDFRRSELEATSGDNEKDLLLTSLAGGVIVGGGLLVAMSARLARRNREEED